MTTFRWGTITDDSPLRVRLDAESTELPFTPDSLIDPASLAVADRVRCEITGGRLVILGKSGGVPEPVIEYPTYARNLIRNARFRINQRGATSGTSLASGAYFLDGWQSGTSTNATTWTGSEDAGRVVTVPSSEVIRQVVERRDVIAGDYMLIWSGTANARVYNEGGSTPSFTADSGTGRTVLPVSLDGSANVRVEFEAGTVSNVMLILGDNDPGVFLDTSYSDDFVRCCRYYYRATPGVAFAWLAVGGQQNTVASHCVMYLPAPMRTQPTVAYSGLQWSDFTASVNVSSLAFTRSPVGMSNIAALFVGHASIGAGARAGGLHMASGTTNYIEFVAEL